MYPNTELRFSDRVYHEDILPWLNMDALIGLRYFCPDAAGIKALTNYELECLC